MAAYEPFSTARLQEETTVTDLEVSRAPFIDNKDRLPAAVLSPKSPAARALVEDGRSLYLGSRRQQMISAIFFLLLLVCWLAVVLTHVTKDHSADIVVRPPPSHMNDYPLPPDGDGRPFSAVANEIKGTARYVSVYYVLHLFAKRDEEVGVSGTKKNLWCAYNGSDFRFKSHHLPLHLCSAVLLCCLTLTAPAGEPSAPNLRFAEFLKLQDTNGTTRPSLMVALGGPQQDPGVLRSLVQRDHGNASKSLATHVLHFVEFNRLDGVLLYTMHCGPDEVAIFRALYERLDYHGYTVAVTCPDGEGGPKMFAEAKIGPVVLIPAAANASRAQCPRGLARRVLDDDESAADVMLGVRLSGVRYTLPAGGEAIAREGAAASLVSSAAYRDVCLAIRDHGWSGYGSATGECVVAHRNRTWMAALTPWALGVPRVVERFAKAGVLVLDVDADDASGACGTRPFPLTDALHRLL
ncbi:hypothetical protein HPB50_007739 [Hyalomma asiaticum]|uniref:Uncharacterized protein n=1 Tax=Hyalomma asiaticum TaxID=266040 RepID=A0ACB7RJR3_HYAAI|nr:hypothetical protein HPB50_007739 [Hyalomma asiaticum]